MIKKEFQNFSKILIRTPSSFYTDLFNENETTKNLDDLISFCLNDKKFLEAIHWSSTQLYNTILDFNKKNFPEVKKRQILLTLKKYLIRSATRSTPYGTFAGTFIQSFTNIRLDEEKIFRRKLRLDINIVRKITRSIESNDSFLPYLSFTVNNSLYSFDNQFRYLEIDKNEQTKPKISSLEKNEVLNFLYLKNKEDKITFNLISHKFSEVFEHQELFSFFRELINVGFLVSELELLQTDKDELKNIRKFINRTEIRSLNGVDKYKDLFKCTDDYITSVENLSFGDYNKDDYKKILELLNNLGIVINDEQIFHVDILNKNINSLDFSETDKKQIFEAISILSKITVPNILKSHIQKFKLLFIEKYEYNYIPLLQVLDPEVGIGFPPNNSLGSVSSNELINFNQKLSENKHPETNNLSDWLIDKIENLSSEEKVIEICSKSLQNFPDRSHSLSHSFNVVGQILGSNRILLQNVGGIHSNTVLSRFAYLDDKIKFLCEDIADWEKEISKDVIFAEIIWIPNGREGNITRKKSYFDYEIPIFYKSSQDSKIQITLDDILVSVHEDEIILISKKLKKRIIPRLSSAHNFLSSTNSVYKFLSSLQNQSLQNLYLDPDFANSKKRFFPRIMYKNVILHQASWILQESDIKTIKTSKEPFKEFDKYIKKWNVEKYILLCQGDNELFLDISNASYLEILMDEIYKNHKIIVLKEWLYTQDQNPSVNQFILPLKNKRAIPFKKLSINNDLLKTDSFYPGSEWIYIKIYCDVNYSDVIIKTIYNKVIKKFENNIVKEWFFIRYNDPHHHLRFRIHINSSDVFEQIMTDINKSLHLFMNKKIIWKIKLDTYEREIKRYFHSKIEIAEYIFYKDSLVFLKLLKNNNFKEDIKLRLFTAVKNVDFWLESFNLTIKEKRDLCESMKATFASEQSHDFILQTEYKYRENKDVLFAFLKSNTFAATFKDRNIELNRLHLTRHNLRDFIHMSLNRWFVSNQRNWEYLVYYFCFNYYNRCIYTSQSLKKDVKKI
jgi:thiopeptide-type bacteriocin biosynthesis protein